MPAPSLSDSGDTNRLLRPCPTSGLARRAAAAAQHARHWPNSPSLYERERWNSPAGFSYRAVMHKSQRQLQASHILRDSGVYMYMRTCVQVHAHVTSF